MASHDRAARAWAAVRHRRGPRPLALHLAAAGPGNAAFLEGLRAYWAHPYRRRVREPPVVWAAGGSRLLDYGPEGAPPVLAVPSLINRAYILDLMPGRSLLRTLSRTGLRPLLLDWGAPGAPERRMTLDDYAGGRLEGALDAAMALAGVRPLLLGYCMGGVLALALAARRGDDLAGLALLATPWNFHAGFDRERLAPFLGGPVCALAGALGGLPVDVLQALFAGVEPGAVARKFARFARLDPASAEARAFVALEDWLNDGVPLGAEVARACLRDWYGANLPARGAWQVGGRAVRPERIDLPALVAIPERDRIVPPASAAALASALPRVRVLRPACGHIGMIVGAHAGPSLRRPLAAWLRRIAAMRKRP